MVLGKNYPNRAVRKKMPRKSMITVLLTLLACCSAQPDGVERNEKTLDEGSVDFLSDSEGPAPSPTISIDAIENGETFVEVGDIPEDVIDLEIDTNAETPAALYGPNLPEKDEISLQKRQKEGSDSESEGSLSEIIAEYVMDPEAKALEPREADNSQDFMKGMTPHTATIWALLLQKEGLLEEGDATEDEPLTIFMPTDNAVTAFLEFGNKTIEDLAESPHLRSLLEHHMAHGKLTPDHFYEGKGGTHPETGENNFVHKGEKAGTLFGNLTMISGDEVPISFASTCKPCIGEGAGPFHVSATTVDHTEAENGAIYLIDEVVLSPDLCKDFKSYNSWQCCGGCSGCDCTVLEAPRDEDDYGAFFSVDLACEAYCDTAEPGDKEAVLDEVQHTFVSNDSEQKSDVVGEFDAVP